VIARYFFKRIDNTSLIVFRILFGALITLEAWGAIATGWVKRMFVVPDFTFHFIGFDFLQPFLGSGMYAYYLIMGLAGLFVCIGYKYRFNIILYSLMWAGVYFSQKSAYNNHYYLQLLLLIFMSLAPAHRQFSLDAKLRPEIKQNYMHQWVWIFIVLQVWIVYTYASIAKLYPDWLDGTATAFLMEKKKDYWLIGDFLQQRWVHLSIAYFGIFFDLLVVPLMLWKPSRKFMFVLSIFFHLFNSIVFGIGIFPYMSLSFTVFFFPAKTVNRLFLKRKPFYDKGKVDQPSYAKPLILFFGLWFLVQIALPLRHWFIKGDVLWTEEGHRLSWRMMLRSKSSSIQIKVYNKSKDDTRYIRTADYLTPKQHKMLSRPDGIWQFCQKLKKIYLAKGEEVEIYVRCMVSINGSETAPMINPDYDMAKAEWDYFWHNPWILLAEEREEYKLRSPN